MSSNVFSTKVTNVYKLGKNQEYYSFIVIIVERKSMRGLMCEKSESVSNEWANFMCEENEL